MIPARRAGRQHSNRLRPRVVAFGPSPPLPPLPRQALRLPPLPGKDPMTPARLCLRSALPMILGLLAAVPAAGADPPALKKGERIVFLGDSITEAGVRPN